MLTMWEAIQARVSCRAYQDRPIKAEKLDELAALVEELNAVSGLHMQLITTDGAKKPHLKLAAAMFDGPVRTYIAMVGGEDALAGEKLGYYGEKLVLRAVQLGLGTCWVGGTYDAKSCCAEVGADEKVWDVIPVGYAAEKTPIKQKMIRASIRARDRKLEQFVESGSAFAQLPEWLKKAVEAVKMGPSAVNQQPMNIVYRDGRVTAKLWKPGHGYAINDMGIAKYQFEVGAAAHGVQGRWEFGDGGEFIIESK